MILIHNKELFDFREFASHSRLLNNWADLKNSMSYIWQYQLNKKLNKYFTILHNNNIYSSKNNNLLTDHLFLHASYSLLWNTSMGVKCTITTGVFFGPSSQYWLSQCCCSCLLDTSDGMNASVGQSMIMKTGPGRQGPVTCSGVIWKNNFMNSKK